MKASGLFILIVMMAQPASADECKSILTKTPDYITHCQALDLPPQAPEQQWCWARLHQFRKQQHVCAATQAPKTREAATKRVDRDMELMSEGLKTLRALIQASPEKEKKDKDAD